MTKEVTPATVPGTHVRFTRDAYCFDLIPRGTTATVRRVSSVPHATSNGGGWDVTVELEGVLVGEWTDTTTRDWQHSSRTTSRALVRSTELEVI